MGKNRKKGKKTDKNNMIKRTARREAAAEKYFNALLSTITVIIFFGVIIAIGAVTAFSEKQEFSETRNGKLAEFPDFTAKKVYNGSFTSGVETYISDHFAGHDSWVTLKTVTELLSGKKESNNIYILKDRLVEKIAEPKEEIISKSVKGIRTFAEKNNVKPYLMIVPTQAEIYSSELPANAPNPDQQAFIGDIYSELSDCTVPIDVYSVLSANSSDYIYYRTDHHWTTKGAFLAYTAASKRMNFTPLTEDDYDIEHAGENFRGTFFSKVLYDGITPDTLDIWLPANGGEEPVVEITSTFDEAPAVHEGMYFREYLDVKDKYSTFFGTNQPMIRLRTGNKGGRLLIFKDSYAHCFVPFLSQHYSEITMLDLRYIQISYDQLVDVSEYDQVLIMYNASTFMSDENIKKLMF